MKQNAQFIPGLKLNEMFARDTVIPLIQRFFPDLKYSLGLVGHGSDVIQADTPESMDHNWGPHLHIFFTEADYITHKEAVDDMLKRNLPYTYKGFATHFKPGNRYLKEVPVIKKSGLVRHLFEFWTPRSFFMHYLGFDINREVSYRDWLLFPQQSLVEVTSGKLFHDDLGVQKLRDTFAYYPDDIWRYMMRVQWGKILDEVVIQARNGEVGDHVGSMMVTARTVEKIMFLCFLMERTYVPYSKWFGTMFQRLKNARTIYPRILEVLQCTDWEERQYKLARVYQHLGRLHNKLGITKPLTTKLISYFGRNYKIIDVWEYVHEIEKTIQNKTLRSMKYPLGSVDQFIDHARINHMDYFYLELENVLR